MSSPDHGGNTDGKTPGRFKTEPDPDMPIEGDDEPSDLIINIKEEPLDDGYCQTYSNTNGDACNGPNDSSERAEMDDTESSNLDEVPETNEDAMQQTEVAKTAIANCVPVTTVPNGGGFRPIIKTKILPRDLKFSGIQTTKQVVGSTRLLPVGLKTSCPIPIALTVNTPEVDPKANRAALTSQTSAHHLMTLATEADKILKRQKKTSEKGSNSDHTDDDKLSNSDEDNMCTSDSSNGIDPFVNCSDQTLTMIQRRAAEASLSASKSKKTKRKRNQLPDDLKDQTYWERRRKNNEAAKRSRDARRAKEDQIAIRAALLEQENMRLKIEVAALKEETIKLRGMLYDKR